MKNQKGISLISLLVTIILILIIATMTLYSGFEAYDNMKIQAFVTKMSALQDRVDVFCDKYTVKEINKMGLSFTQTTAEQQAHLKSVITRNASVGLKCWSAVDDSESNYRYFSTKDIEEKIGFKDFDVAIWLNPLTRNVIAEEGVKYNDIMYYRQYDLPGGQTLEQPVINSDTTLAYNVRTYDGKADIVLNKTFAKVTCYLKNETSIISTKVYTHVDTVTVTDSGKYQIVATDYDKNVNDYPTELQDQYAGLEKTTEDITVTIVNKPLLAEGMVPISDVGRELLTENDLRDWYNYDSSVKHWANARLPDGSIYVWIPRYAYKVSNEGTEVRFLRDYSNITTEGKPLDNGFKIMPAFQDGSTLVPSPFANGEWDSELSGFWVAKYEATYHDGLPMSAASNSTQAWTKTPIEAFKLCRELEKSNLLFGYTVSSGANGDVLADGYFPSDTNNIDTHLMKNSEYGAVIYLTNSKYGNPGMKWQSGYYPGTGDAAETVSTTGNEYGIYGIGGGRPEIAAAGINIAGVFNASDKNISTRYATVYENNTSVVGDGINDVEVSFWNTGITRIFPDATNPIFARGGDKTSGNMFTYNGASTTSDSTNSFRPAIVVAY